MQKYLLELHAPEIPTEIQELVDQTIKIKK
jgi:hypothetical protein